MDRDFLIFVSWKCSGQLLESMAYDVSIGPGDCHQRCLERADCGAVSIAYDLCRVMDTACTSTNGVTSSAYTMWERTNWETTGDVVFALGDARSFFLTSASKFDLGGIFDVSPENDRGDTQCEKPLRRWSLHGTTESQ